jgi:alpha-D-ribose 1-methylphosphonate 5-triphosphate synthase subunit PhnI
VRRRVSAAFKDIPGGQVLGPSFDYTHRLLDFALASSDDPPPAPKAEQPLDPDMPRVTDTLGEEGLIEPNPKAAPEAPVPDLTQEPLEFPADRPMRLQALARGDEGFLLALGYSTQRGYGRNHPFAGEIRYGAVAVEFVPPELGFPVEVGTIELTECQMVNQFAGSEAAPPQFTRGYGLAFGHSERKAMAMALVDRALRAEELGEPVGAPAQDEEFVLAHADNVEASGFVQHLKLPHYVDFQSELMVLRALRTSWHEASAAREKARDRPPEAAE